MRRGKGEGKVWGYYNKTNPQLTTKYSMYCQDRNDEIDTRE